MIIEHTPTEKTAALFQGWQETLIWSCLQGIMGKIYVKACENPLSGMAMLGDFCFLAGEPDKELVRQAPQLAQREFFIIVPQHEGWSGLIEDCFKENTKRVVRYALKKEPDVFCEVKLQSAVSSLPDGYTLKMIDEELFWQCRKHDWCRDWTAQYADYKMFQTYGLGVAVLKDGVPVSGASSYSGFKGGIEIEIDTREDHRRKGLAYACGAELILECLKRGWYPSWDAQNKWSLALAEKLGYHFEREYTAYEVVGHLNV
ncbi:MAG: GNAT family N-acetyltransferase [Eubacterium sp.]|nr:GNAT family N-acetyltransferase [Eubacterium sp.]